MRKSLISLFFIFEIGTLHAQNYSYNVDEDYNDQISYDKLKKDIIKYNVKTLEGALDLIPKSFYENYVLMYKSRSLQSASPLYPRAIVFGKSAKFIMAFNGEKTQRGYNNLEIVEFKDKSNSWEFREITFISGKTPAFSKANPQKCLECHQSSRRKNIDPRPNWEPYDFWPGAYASVENTLEPKLKNNYVQAQQNQEELSGVLKKFLDQDYVLIEEQALEKQNFLLFTKNIKPNHSRYKKLDDFNLRSTLSFTKVLATLNMKRLVRLIREELGENLFSIYKYSLLGLANADANKYTQLKFMCRELNLPIKIRDQHLEVLKTYGQVPEKSKYEDGQKNKADLAVGLEILFKPLGLITEDWSMDFKTGGRFAFINRFGSPSDSPMHLRDAYKELYPDDPVLEMDCLQLKQKAEESFKNKEDFVSLSLVSFQKESVKPLIQKCISCHSDKEAASYSIPQIPFDDLISLKNNFSQKTYPRGTLLQEIIYRTGPHASFEEQMPPSSGQLKAEYREDLIKLLKVALDEPRS